jgi:hypothetical protein
MGNLISGIDLKKNTLEMQKQSLEVCINSRKRRSVVQFRIDFWVEIWLFSVWFTPNSVFFDGNWGIGMSFQRIEAFS